MPRSVFSEDQIVAILKEGDTGKKVADICRAHRISPQTYYRWKSTYGTLEMNVTRRLRQLEAENRRLKQLVAELTLGNRFQRTVLAKK